MFRNTPLTWRLGIAGFALLTAIAVYCFARLYPPELLAPLQATSSFLAAQSSLFGSAPSFFYTLSIGLFIGACASSPAGARLHCSIWIGLALVLELTQASIIATPLAQWLPDFVWELFGSYWTRGVFDPLDMAATIAGGMIALALLTWLPAEKYNATDR